MPLETIFQNQFYAVHAKPSLLIIERKRVETGSAKKGKYMTGDKADEWSQAFKEEGDKDVSAAYCRAILN